MYEVSHHATVTLYCDVKDCEYRERIEMFRYMPHYDDTSAALTHEVLTRARELGWDVKRHGRLLDMLCPFHTGQQFEADIQKRGGRPHHGKT